jgi:hypothetical protein
VQDNGQKLEVRGYIGISLLGRSQIWHRVPQPDLTVRAFVLQKDGKTEPVAWAPGHEPGAKAAEPAAPAATPAATPNEPAAGPAKP